MRAMEMRDSSAVFPDPLQTGLPVMFKGNERLHPCYATVMSGTGSNLAPFITEEEPTPQKTKDGMQWIDPGEHYKPYKPGQERTEPIIHRCPLDVAPPATTGGIL